jgi:hypothetical protein
MKKLKTFCILSIAYERLFVFLTLKGMIDMISCFDVPEIMVLPCIMMQTRFYNVIYHLSGIELVNPDDGIVIIKVLDTSPEISISSPKYQPELLTMYTLSQRVENMVKKYPTDYTITVVNIHDGESVVFTHFITLLVWFQDNKYNPIHYTYYADNIPLSSEIHILLTCLVHT